VAYMRARDDLNAPPAHPRLWKSKPKYNCPLFIIS
jgi:hypothetical protein